MASTCGAYWSVPSIQFLTENISTVSKADGSVLGCTGSAAALRITSMCRVAQRFGSGRAGAVAGLLVWASAIGARRDATAKQAKNRAKVPGPLHIVRCLRDAVRVKIATT